MPTGHGMPNAPRPGAVPPPLPPRNPTLPINPPPHPPSFHPPSASGTGSTTYSGPPGSSYGQHDNKLFGSSTAKKWLNKTNEVIDQNVTTSRKWWDQTAQVIDHRFNPYLADPRYNPWARPPPAFGTPQGRGYGYGPPAPGQPSGYGQPPQRE